jgi:hypothetical protein
VVRVLGIGVCPKASDSQQRKPGTESTSRRASVLPNRDRLLGDSLARAHHTDCPLLPVGAGFYLEGD